MQHEHFHRQSSGASRVVNQKTRTANDAVAKKINNILRSFAQPDNLIY